MADVADTQDNTASGLLRFAGDVSIEKVMITSLITGRTFNVANQLLTIQIFEDLFSPFISGSLIFRESLDFANNFPFVGEEIVDLKIYTPTLERQSGKNGVIEGRFYIYKMADREEIGERNIAYQLHFINIDALADLNNKVSRAYDGKISDLAKQVLTDPATLGTEKKVNVEETSNKIKYISNWWSPIRNINFMIDHAVNTKGSPTYVFFENRNGYNFVSLDTLNEGEKVQKFVYNNSQDEINPAGGSTRRLDLDFSRIVEMKVPVSHDFMERATRGTYGSTMTFNDLTSKRYIKQKFSMFDGWGEENKQVRLNKFPMASKNVLTSYSAKVFNEFIEVNVFTGYGDVSNVRTIQNRVSRLTQAEAFKLEITVAGRTDYTVGQVVSVKTFQPEPMYETDSMQEQKDKLISGNYLISAINHEITREKHDCNMELIKDSLTINLDNKAKSK